MVFFFSPTDKGQENVVYNRGKNDKLVMVEVSTNGLKLLDTSELPINPDILSYQQQWYAVVRNVKEKNVFPEGYDGILHRSQHDGGIYQIILKKNIANKKLTGRIKNLRGKYVEDTISKYLNESVDNTANIRKYLYDYFKLNNIIEPATTPLKPNHVRLYHQTDLEKFENIKREGKININRSTGKENQEPMIVWGSIIKHRDDRGFYGYPKKRFTIEYQLPNNEVDKGTGGVARTVNADEIIAYHDPRLFNIKEIVDDDGYLNEILNSLEFFLTFSDANPLDNEYAYYLIANAIKKKK